MTRATLDWSLELPIVIKGKIVGYCPDVTAVWTVDEDGLVEIEIDGVTISGADTDMQSRQAWNAATLVAMTPRWQYEASVALVEARDDAKIAAAELRRDYA